MASSADVTDQLDPFSLYCNPVVNNSGAYFSNFEISQKMEEKLHNYNLFTTVIRTKRTFPTAKKKIRG